MAPRRRDERPLRRRHDGSQGKSLDGAAYMGLRDQAISRAKRLELLHTTAGRQFPNDNPSSGMYHLLEAIEPTGDQR